MPKETDALPLDPEAVFKDQLTRPGYDIGGGVNLPFIGVVPDIKEDDPNRVKPTAIGKTYVRIYDLRDQKQMEAYQSVSQRASEKRTQISYEERKFVESPTPGWLVLIRWTDFYAVMKG